MRIGPDGVWRNARSPATYINLDRYGRTTLPAEADAAADPDWQQVSTEPHYVWHDHRTHWMSENLLPPQVVAEPDRSHDVFDWTVPVRHGDTPVVVAGELTWDPRRRRGSSGRSTRSRHSWPSRRDSSAARRGSWACSSWPARRRRSWHAAATPEPPQSVASHAGAIVSALMPAAIATLVAVLGLRAAFRGRGALTGLLAVVVGWLLLVQGLPDMDVLWSANVASAGPEVAARAAVALLIALGVGLVPGGIAAVRRFRELDPGPGRLEAAPAGSVS